MEIDDKSRDEFLNYLIDRVKLETSVEPVIDRFHDDVIKGITALMVGQKNIEVHLAKLNGSVAEHAKLLIESQNDRKTLHHDLEMHPFTCKLAEKVESMGLLITTKQVEQETSKNTSAKWLDWIKPLIWATGAIFLYIFLTHVDIVLKKLGG